MKTAGYDVAVMNWRMVAAAPGLSAEQKAAVTADIDKMPIRQAEKQHWKPRAGPTSIWPDRSLRTQLATEVASATAILKDIGLVQ